MVQGRRAESNPGGAPEKKGWDDMKQSEKLTQLLELMQANPELPVIPCVDGDVVSGDEYYCWLGSWGESAVQEFIIGKESTQEEFFHTFNHLHVSGKQIIISSDKPPKDIETLEARLRTRFEWGLIADISSPDYETRMAILRKKEELDGLEKYHIPDEVMQYIANNIKSNIRELEGSLNKLIALSNLENKPIDIPLAAEALKDMISPDDTRAVSPELIMDVVSEHFNVPVAELKGKKRNAEIVLPRQIVMYLSLIHI